jgi:hypothetical protein
MNHNDPLHDAILPELLAAYADGELDAAERGRVEEWIAANSNGIVELETQKRLGRRHGRLWQWHVEPSEAAWQRTLHSINMTLSAPRPLAATGRSRRRLLTALAALAAAIVFAVFWFPRESGDKGVAKTAPVDGFACATADDVEIMRIFEVDVDRLVIGEPPLRRAVVLASFEDVDGLNVLRDTDGMMPAINMQKAVAPMIVAPVAVK